MVSPPALVQPAPVQTPLQQAQQALWEGRPEDSLRLLQGWLQAHPDDADALVVAGFASLRLGQLPAATAHFQHALKIAPAYADAAYGLGLCLTRQKRHVEARVQLEKALSLEPSRKDLQEAVEQARLMAPDPPPPLPPLARPATLQMPSRIADRQFEVSDGRGGWRPIFIKGMNLGAALPGKYPSQFPDKTTYAGWIEEMAEVGVNAIRVYTIHPPGLYEALAEYNAKAARPIWLIHGVWAELPPEDDFLDDGWWSQWREEMQKVVDLLHGRASLPPQPGHASGVYRADVSKWTLAIILGREWEPYSVEAHNARHPGLGDFRGRFLSVRQGHATEVFMTQAMDHFLAYEFDTYHAQRPMAYTNWPTLDPLFHPTEATKEEELEWRRKLGLPLGKTQINEYDNDALGLDMEKVDTLPLCQAGLFASYHAYPYYPDFLNLDPGYAQGRDAEGPNNYFAYLQDLVRHHQKYPVVISEFGVPSSRLVAHWQPQGMTHGGQSEREQGEQDVRLFRNIYDSGCAGGMLFAWIDEWFKKNWLVIDYEVPLDRKPLWYNAHDAEENYGLIAYRPGTLKPRIRIDGQAGDWADVPDYLAGPDLRLKVLADEGWLHLALFFKGPVPDWAKEGFAVGIDTHDPVKGDHRLPWDLGLRSQAGLEFMVRFQGPQTALYADAPYDLFTHHLDRPIRSVDNDAGQFVMPRTESNRARIGRDGTRYPNRQQEIGWLRRGTQDRAAADFDSRSEWLEGDAGGGWSFLEARIPWGLLNVTDPSSRLVVQDPVQADGEVGTFATDGFRLSLVRFRTEGKHALHVTASLPKAQGDLLPLPPLYTWPTWEVPTFHKVRKQSFDLVKNGLHSLPEVGRTVAAGAAVTPPPAAPAVASLALLLEQARKARDAGRLPEALRCYDAMLAQVPEHETALLERAETLGWAGRYPEAQAGYQAYRRAFPAHALTADLALAKLAAWQDHTTEALDLLEPWVKQGQRQAVLDAATYLSWRARFPESLTRLRQWLANHPGDREAILLEAKVLSWAGRNADARTAYGRVLASHPDDREALIGLTRLALWEGDAPEARRTLERMTPEVLAQPESQLMLAQVELAEGHARQARGRIKTQAAGGPVRRDAEELEEDLTRANGPWVELATDRTDTSEGLRMTNPGLRARLPLGDGAVTLAQTFHSSAFYGVQSRPSETRVGLAYPLAKDLSGTGSLSYLAGSGIDPSLGYALGLNYTPLPGLSLNLANEKSLALFTPQAAALHTTFVTTDLGATWRFGQGRHALRAGLGHADVTSTLSGIDQSSTRHSALGSYEYRFPVTALDLRGGLMLRDFGYSQTLPLGFFNPERYHWLGAFGSATWRQGRVLELSLGATAGNQAVNGGGAEFTWSYRVGATWSPRSWPVDLGAWWSQSFAGLPVTTPLDPSNYQEHTLGISLRLRCNGWM